jgi:hypothetical protein
LTKLHNNTLKRRSNITKNCNQFKISGDSPSQKIAFLKKLLILQETPHKIRKYYSNTSTNCQKIKNIFYYY